MDLPDHRYKALPAQAGARRNVAPLLWASLVTLCLWYVPYSNYLLYPLRLFVTFVHESGHAIAGLATGLGVGSLHVNPNGSGLTWVGQSLTWDWLTLSGGYVGAAIFGALLLQASRIGRPHSRGKIALYGASAYILLVTVLWARNPFATAGAPDFFTPIVGVALAAGLFCLARLLSPRWAEFASSFLAVQCGLNALGDLRTLLYLTSSGFSDNDAVFMQRHYLVPAVVWAVTWAVIAVIVLGASLWSYVRAPRTGAASGSI